MLRPQFLAADVAPDARRNGVSRIVLVQMSYYGFDNSYMLDAMRAAPQTFRGIAVIDPGSTDLETKMRQLAASGVRGFRINTVEHKNWADDTGIHKMFHEAGKKDLAIWPLLNPHSLAQFDRLCGRFPDTPVIIDHIARIGMSGQPLDSDVKALCAIARHPQTRVKLSAFYALGNKRAPHLDLAPLIQRVHEAFGANRLMWGSDCPFQTQTETYLDSLSLIRDRLDFHSAQDKDWILRRTAEEFFFAS
jgi:predicted TIM-barrel fold metal-dependent hydrolase